VRVPPWLILGIAAIVILFGLYRIRLALKPAETDPAKQSALGKGFYRMAPRTHLMIGILYLGLGGALIATSFGWNPFGSSKPAEQTTPTKPVAK
jgi:hypothetical protein